MKQKNTVIIKQNVAYLLIAYTLACQQPADLQFTSVNYNIAQ